MMNNNTRNEFASYGLEILKRSVLLVLYEQPLDHAGRRKSVHQNTIRKYLGIPKPIYTPNRFVHGILDILADDACVEPSGVAHWRIIEKGIAVIEGHHRT